ncbi:hypothetical protein KRP22_004002 [Phytophthora ramorum]|nr:Thioredoxin [Phytophthora ramorum]
MIAIASAEEFHAAVAKTELPVVACFSAPWCGGCKMVAPKVAALAGELQTRAQFVQVSAEQLETLCEEVEVDSFPHFRVYNAGAVLGDITSSKIDKVEAFIRALVAPDTANRQEGTPEEDDAVVEEATKGAADKAAAENEGVVEAEVDDGSKKRQEREEMEENDEHVAKKAKTEELEAEKTKEEVDASTNEEAGVVPTEKTEIVVEAEQEKTEAEKPGVVEVAADVMEKEEAADESAKEKEAAPADKLEAIEATEVNGAQIDTPAA